MDVESCRFLNFRTHLIAENCPHCQRHGRLRAHGFLKSASGEIRGIRLYCSNRRGLRGCGRTFSSHFVDRMPNATLGTAQVGAILEAAHGAVKERPGAESKRPAIMDALAGICSRSTAYRWIRRFRLLQCLTFRPLLYQVIGRDEEPYTGTPEQRVWDRMRSAFGGATQAIGAIQMCFQRAVFPIPGKDVRPKCHRDISEVIARYLMATGFGTALMPECGYFGWSTRRLIPGSG